MPRITLAMFIHEQKLTATVEVDYNYNPSVDGIWARDACHYKVTLRRGRVRIVVPFHQGSAHTELPTAADVLNCLIMDASGANEDFDSWCREYGYDSDSRKAEKTYRQVQAQTAKLRWLLGDAFDRISDVDGL